MKLYQQAMTSCQQNLGKIKRLPLIILVIFFLSTCAAVDVKKTRTLPEPRLSVYIKPQKHISLHDKTAKLAPIMLPEGYDDTFRRQLTELIRDVLLQHRLFKVIEITFDKVGSREEFAKKSHSEGFDYILILRAPDFLPPAGLSQGWVSIDIFIIHAKTNTTLWHIYSETTLTPEPEKDYIFFSTKFKHAPTITQGILSLLSAISNYIKMNAS